MKTSCGIWVEHIPKGTSLHGWTSGRICFRIQCRNALASSKIESRFSFQGNAQKLHWSYRMSCEFWLSDHDPRLLYLISTLLFLISMKLLKTFRKRAIYLPKNSKNQRHKYSKKNEIRNLDNDLKRSKRLKEWEWKLYCLQMFDIRGNGLKKKK